MKDRQIDGFENANRIRKIWMDKNANNDRFMYRQEEIKVVNNVDR